MPFRAHGGVWAWTVPSPILAILTYLVMAGQFTVTKLGLDAGLSAWDIAMLRYAAAGLVALVVLRNPRCRDELVTRPWRYAAVGLLGGAPYGAIFTLATAMMPASHSTLFAPSMVIVCTLALSGVMLGVWPSPTRLFGVAVILAGLAVFARGAGAQFDMRAIDGDAIFLAVGVMWGLFSVLLRLWDLNPVCCVAAMGFTGAPAFLAWLAAAPSGLGHATAGVAVIEAVFQGLFLTFGAFLGYMVLVRRVGPSVAALGIATVPPLGVLIAMVVLGETAHLGQWIGAAIVVVGLAISTGITAGSLWRALGPHAFR